MEFRNNNIELSQLPEMEKVEWTPLEPNYLKIMYLNTIFLWFLLIAWLVLSYFFQFWEGAGWSWAVTAFLIFLPVITTILVKPSYKVKAYALRTHDIMYQTGLISRSQTVIPFDRVQHCEIGRGVLSR